MTMRQLTIDYVLDGRRRGYSFTSPTDDLHPEVLKTIWRNAMPRGQGWGAEVYCGAVSLKCFPLPSGEVAFCETVITDKRDEVGRTGIRQTVIDVMTANEHVGYLQDRLRSLPAHLTAEAESRLTSREWQLLFKKNREAKRPKSMIKPQTILAYPYEAGAWQFVEACILLLASRATLLTNLIEVSPKVNPFADRVLSFTTLALDYQEEGRIVALPLDRARTLDGIPFIDISEAL
jgi:hypothetical protein